MGHCVNTFRVPFWMFPTHLLVGGQYWTSGSFAFWRSLDTLLFWEQYYWRVPMGIYSFRGVSNRAFCSWACGTTKLQYLAITTLVVHVHFFLMISMSLLELVLRHRSSDICFTMLYWLLGYVPFCLWALYLCFGIDLWLDSILCVIAFGLLL